MPKYSVLLSLADRSRILQHNIVALDPKHLGRSRTFPQVVLWFEEMPSCSLVLIQSTQWASPRTLRAWLGSKHSEEAVCGSATNKTVGNSRNLASALILASNDDHRRGGLDWETKNGHIQKVDLDYRNCDSLWWKEEWDGWGKAWAIVIIGTECGQGIKQSFANCLTTTVRQYWTVVSSSFKSCSDQLFKRTQLSLKKRPQGQRHGLNWSFQASWQSTTIS